MTERETIKTAIVSRAADSDVVANKVAFHSCAAAPPSVLRASVCVSGSAQRHVLPTP